MKFKKIFFSYSRADADFALKLARDLKKDGFDVWIDQEDIPAAAEWDVEIGNALTTCDCLLFIQSEKSVASNNVLDEVYYAIEENKRVIPVLIDNCKTPYRLNRLQHISFIEDYETGLANLKNNLSADSFPEITTYKEKLAETTAKKFPVKYSLIALLILAVIIIFMYSKKTKPQQQVQLSVQPMQTENYLGNWTLKNITPAEQERKGYLKIEDAGEGKVNIKSSFQFYYARSNDTAFLDVFNGFIQCASCALKDSMVVTDKQIDVVAHKYAISTKGDTTLNAGMNKAVRASVTLLLINKDSVMIKVVHPDIAVIADGVVVPPFEYSFLFTKAD